MARAAALGVVVALTALWGCEDAPPPQPDPAPAAPVDQARPNFLILMPDSLRADRPLRVFDGLPLAPSLTALARRGAVFEHAVSQAGWTIPALATAMTGRYPLVPEPNAERLGWMEPDHSGFAEVLALYGYSTTAFVGTRADALRGVFTPHFDQLVVASGRAPYHRGAAAELTQWLRAGPEEPFLAFVHDVDLRFVANVDDLPRWPGATERCEGAFVGRESKPLDIVALRPCLDPDDDLAAVGIAEVYDAALASYDRALGEVLQALDQTGLVASTVIVLSSPHGHHLGENGRFHHSTLYEPDLRIPLIWVEPDAAEPGLAVERTVQLMDLAPSILARAGAPREQTMLGQSLLPLLGLADGDYLERGVFSVNDRHTFSLRTGRMELQRLHAHGTQGGPPEARVRHQLFDLVADPTESRNLWEEPPGDQAAALRDRLRAFERTMLERGPSRPAAGPAAGDQLLRQHLKDDGYWRHVDPGAGETD